MGVEPLVSVIMPAYNRAHLIAESIQSVLGQSEAEFELIVLDDGSCDGTLQVAEKLGDKRIKALGLDHSGHLSRLRNQGLAEARGELVAFLDSDDLWRKDKLERQIEALQRYPQAGWSICGYEVFDEQGVHKRRLYEETLPRRGEEALGSLFPDLIRTKIVIYSSTVLMRKSVLETTGALDEGLRTSDYEFFTRLAHHFPAVLLRLPLVRIRKHPGNTSLQLEEEGLLDAIRALRRFRRQGALKEQAYRETAASLRHNLGKLYQRQGKPRAAQREFRIAQKLAS